MKKTILFSLCAMMLLSVVYAAAPALQKTAYAESTAPAPAPDAHTYHYGMEMSIIADHNGFTGELFYPQGEVEPINIAISDWANTTFLAMEKQAQDGATLLVNYDSYEFENRFVGIKEFGLFNANGKDAVTDIIYTFNFDLSTGKSLSLANVIDSAHTDAVSALLTAQIKKMDKSILGTAKTLSANQLTNFVVRDDGIEWLFTGEMGIVSVLLDYNTLSPYLTLMDPRTTAAPTPVITDKPTIEQMATCIHNGCHVRSGPSTKDTYIIDTIYEDTRLEVLQSNVTNGWHEIWYNDQIAYIAASLIRLDTQPAKFYTGWVTSNILHVRADESVRSEKLGTLSYQDRIELVFETSHKGWYKIWCKDQYAYVYAKYVHVGSRPIATAAPDSTTPAPAPAPAPQPRMISDNVACITGMGTCTTNGVIVRATPSTSAEVYGRMNSGEQVYLVEQEYSDGWDKVFIYTSGSKGYIGYIHSKYVQTMNPRLVTGITA
ncbi:MAG: SH3 domain-containing protein [Clostridia bacterium]